MLHKTKSNRVAILKYGFMMPLFAGMLVFSAACTKDEKVPVQLTEKTLPNEMMSNEKTDASSEIMDFASVEVLPEFPGGGIQAFIDFLSKNYKYPAEARKQGVTGRVIMSFVVEKDGSLTDIKVLRDLGLGTGEEAIRMLNLSPKWKPGLQDGRPVRVAYALPFKLDLAKVEPKSEN